MSLLLKLSNWLSGGALSRYQRQLESTQVKLDKTLSKLEIKSHNLTKIQQEFAIIQTKLNISQAELEIAQHELQNNSNTLTKPHNWLDQINKKTKILDLNLLPIEDSNALWGFNLGSPRTEMKISGGAIVIKGWILGKKTTVTHLKISCGKQLLTEIPVNQPSKWLAKTYPNLPEAENSSFETAITVSGAPEEAELLIEAVFGDRSYLPLATFRFQQLTLVVV